MVRQRLRETGWTLYPPMVSDTEITSAARRGNTTLTLVVYREPITMYAGPTVADSAYLTIDFQRATPPAVYPFAVIGGIAGAVVAFLLFGWASRRADGRRLAGRVVPILFGVTMVLWWAPTLFAFPVSVQHHLDRPHPSWQPMWEWLGQPDLLLLFVVGGGFALLSLAVAALPRPRAEALTTVARS